MDWLIFNTGLCRAFKTALLITEYVIRRKWCFPTRSRSAPIEQIKYFVEKVRLFGYTADMFRCDEEGYLVTSTQIMTTCIAVSHMVVTTTEGYNSKKQNG